MWVISFFLIAINKKLVKIVAIEMPKYISPWLVRGNWVLVKVHDFNNQFKTGWFEYRGSNGKLKMFIKL